ncbi:MAG: hypothetical protein HC923_01580 [Myxococcales bacterium]|nr:hypothetical protein [Myxococcales bacterium]
MGVSLEDLDVAPEQIVLAVGAVVQIEVEGRLSDGQRVDLTSGVQGTTYASSAPTIASVSRDGLVRGLGPGSSVVRVVQGSFTVSVPVTVVPVPASITELIVEPSPIFLDVSEERRVRVLGRSGSQLVVLPQDELQFRVLPSSTGMFARVNAAGVVTGLMEGEAILRVERGTLFAETEIQIGMGTRVVSLSVEPEEFELRSSESVQLEVLAVFANGTGRDVSADGETSYRALAPFVRVGPTGLVTAERAGETAIIVSYRQIVTQVRVIVIDDGPPTALTVTPNPLALAVGGFVDVRVIASYRSGDELNVTLDAAFLAPASGELAWDATRRVMRGVRTGFGDFAFRFDGITATVPFVVVDDIDDLVLEFDPNPIVVEVGEDVEFSLRARLPSGISVEITFFDDVEFVIADPRIAEAVPGLVTGTAIGSTILEGRVSGEIVRVAVEVVPSSDRPFESLALSAPPSIRVQRPVGYRVVALRADGTGADVTSSSELSVTTDRANVVRISGAGLIGLSAGQATIRANFRGLSSERSVSVSALADPVTGLQFRPPSLSLDVLEIGTTRAEARTDGAPTPINVSESSDLLLVQSPELSADVRDEEVRVVGLRQTSAAGGRLLAFYRGLSTTLPVQVAGASLTRLLVEIPLATLPVGAEQLVFVFGVLSDGSVIDVTDLPGLEVVSSNPSVLGVEQDDGGVIAFALAPGSAAVIATLGTFAADAAVEVRR